MVGGGVTRGPRGLLNNDSFGDRAFEAQREIPRILADARPAVDLSPLSSPSGPKPSHGHWPPTWHSLLMQQGPAGPKAQKQMTPRGALATSVLYRGTDLSLIAPFAQFKHSVHGSPNPSATQSESTVHD